MSDCNVCLYADDGDMAEVFTKRDVRGRKPYRCVECDRPIAKGELHQFAKMLCGGEWSEYRTCLICAEIRAAFYCEGEIYGEFWSQFQECFGELNITCLDRLKTVLAKKYLLARWNDWKALHD